MKKKGMIAAVVLLLIAISGKAQDYKMGLGIRFSTQDAAVNHSISFKYFFSESTAAEALLSFGDPLALGLLVEKHKPVVNNLKWFYGGGAYVGFGDNRNVGAQGVLGLDYKFPSLPINLSMDWKPELNLYKEFSFEPAALGISARFIFK